MKLLLEWIRKNGFRDHPRSLDKEPVHKLSRAKREAKKKRPFNLVCREKREAKKVDRSTYFRSQITEFRKIGNRWISLASLEAIS